MTHQAVRAIIVKDNQLLVMKRDKFGKQYCTLVGGGIDVGEDPETALRRELHEETGLSVGAMRFVFNEEADDPYGTQLVFLCEYQGGEPVLNPDSEEAKISAMGQNLYQPVWLPLADLPATNFLSTSLKAALLDGLKNGWPKEPKALVWQYTSVAS